MLDPSICMEKKKSHPQPRGNVRALVKLTQMAWLDSDPKADK